jgi:hypothetical protein
MDFWRRPARKSRNKTFPYSTIRGITDIEKTILVVTEEKRLRWFWICKENDGKQIATENPRMGTTRNTKVEKAQERWTDGRSKT